LKLVLKNSPIKNAIFFCFFFLFILVASVFSLDNGLALTPPMGWNSWNAYRTDIDEDKIKKIADAMVDSKMKEVGYQFVVIDDGWVQYRDVNGGLVANSTKFPGGLKALADYVHSKGLKFGIYSSPNPKTCAGLPGSFGFEQQDADSFASWGVDYIKYDGCGTFGQEVFTLMRDCLKKTGRDIVYSTNVNFYNDLNARNWIPEVSNLWRTTNDIKDHWGPDPPPLKPRALSILQIVNLNEPRADLAGPGHWNDCDMLEVGNYGLDGNYEFDADFNIIYGMTDEEYRSHFSLWCMMASPLMAGNDLTTMNSVTKEILTAAEVIAVNQDSLGQQGRRIVSTDSLEIWKKKLKQDGAWAILALNLKGVPTPVTMVWQDLGLMDSSFAVRDLWSKQDVASECLLYSVSSVPAHGVVMLKVISNKVFLEKEPNAQLESGMTLSARPFGAQVIIRCGWAAGEKASYIIRNINGQKIKEFSLGVSPRGQAKEVLWNGEGVSGKRISSGVFIGELKSSNHQSLFHHFLLVH